MAVHLTDQGQGERDDGIECGCREVPWASSLNQGRPGPANAVRVPCVDHAQSAEMALHLFVTSALPIRGSQDPQLLNP